MSARTVHIALTVKIDHEKISGQASEGTGTPCPFSGWLGLLGLLDELLSLPGPPSGHGR